MMSDNSFQQERTHMVIIWDRDVLCKDREFLEMISNHTKEDISGRWKMLERERRKRKPKVMTTMQYLRESATTFDQKRNPEPHYELKLAATLTEEQKKKDAVARRLRKERAALLAAETKIAKEMKEREKLQLALAEYETLMKSTKVRKVVFYGCAACSYPGFPSLPRCRVDAERGKPEKSREDEVQPGLCARGAGSDSLSIWSTSFPPQLQVLSPSIRP